MKCFNYYILIISSQIGFLSAALCQDLTFSQFQEMPLLRNPSIAGIFKGDIRVQSAYRSQWLSVTTPYKTMALSTEVRFPVGSSDNYFTTSLQVSNDEAGDSRLRRTQILPAINFLKSINNDNGYLSLGFLGGWVQSQFDPTKMTFDDQFQNGQFNPANSTNQTFSQTSTSFLDAAVGISYSDMVANGTEIYLGGAYYHFNKPRASFNGEKLILQPRYVANLGIKMKSGENDLVYVYVDHIRQESHRQTLTGIHFQHFFSNYEDDENISLTLGGIYRWADAIIPVLKFEFLKMAIGISYDINISRLNTASQLRGGFEITASCKSSLNMRNSSQNQTKCPPRF